jgi:hypothetical protein
MVVGVSIVEQVSEFDKISFSIYYYNAYCNSVSFYIRRFIDGWLSSPNPGMTIPMGLEPEKLTTPFGVSMEKDNSG